MREVLHQDELLTISLVVDDDEARVEIETAPEGPDLSEPDEVIVAVDGKVCSLTVQSPRFAYAVLIEEAEIEAADHQSPDEVSLPSGRTSAVLMVRVHEFFEGWETE